MKQPRLAEMVASELRERILSGELPDGSLLRTQEDLLEEYQVSGPSVREALRILETEGLATVRRGNVGGTVVHVPGEESAAYMLGLVLQARKVNLPDVAAALQLIEPLCAGMCAARSDRRRAVLPRLRAINAQSEKALDDIDESIRLAREFHRELVDQCRNDTMILVVDALETLWAAQVREWARQEAVRGLPTPAARRTGIEDHAELIRLIDLGDVEGARHAAAQHLKRSQRDTIGDDTRRVKASLVRPDRT